ncbi:hypothetical protein QYE76_059021 [Lolium multiflorum]|uniref:Transposase-associated domain-containing protein n=1 Tax=Lolium multiflorum TaxID=4521 RepID=A0AAD8T6L8_LOLMU|nr:hypothetical protein QYE76_059021 [Lolium multiflorum]
MYKGRASRWEFTDEWKEKTKQFVNSAFAIPSRPAKVLCPCNKFCNNKRQTKEEVSKHLLKDRFRQSMWMNAGCQLRDEGYQNKFTEVHDDDVDPLTAPFDPEVAVLAGQGKRNGRLWIGDGSVDTATIPSLRQVRRGRKSSQPRVETCPTPSSVAMDQIRAWVEELNRMREEAEAKAWRMEEQMIQQQQLTQQQQMM